MSIFNRIEKKEAKISLIGLGYVGLPIALEFARKYSVIGFDISEKRVKMMQQGIDPSRELASDAFKGTDILFTSNLEDLRKADFHVVAVPTPIDKNNLPDLGALKKASETVGKIVKRGDYIVFESTVYPGATEEDCIPVIEQISGLKFKTDFKVGYSPERINPGDTHHTLTNVVKVVSGCDDESAEEIAKVYASIVKAGIHKASSIKVAEAAKVIENTQRDLNIALMNELSFIFNKMGINTYDVLEAAGTKWNFLKFYPGLVGGHCIGVDPYYLTFKAMEIGHYAQVITSGRSVNDSVSKYIATEMIKALIKTDCVIQKSRILVMGITFKENVSDIRNSKVADVVHELESYGVKVEVVDPFADPEEVKEEYGIDLANEPNGKYEGIVLAVSHDAYAKIQPNEIEVKLTSNGVFFDVKGLLRNKEGNYTYLSL